MNFKSLDINQNVRLKSLVIRAKTNGECKIYAENCKNIESISLDIEGGKIKEFDIHNHPGIVGLSLLNNKFLTELNLSKFTRLEGLQIGSTYLQQLTLPVKSNLVSVSLYNNFDLHGLDLSSHSKLRTIHISDMSSLASLVLPTNPDSPLFSVSIFRTPYLLTVDLGKYTNLNKIDLREMTYLREIDISGSKNIEYMLSIDNPKMEKNMC